MDKSSKIQQQTADFRCLLLGVFTTRHMHAHPISLFAQHLTIQRDTFGLNNM